MPHAARRLHAWLIFDVGQKMMKRVWRILNSRSVTQEMLCWAADSKIGAVCAILFWVVLHVVLVLILVTGNSGFHSRAREPWLFWFEVLPSVIGLPLTDAWIVWGIFRDRRRENAQQGARANVPIGHASCYRPEN